MIRNAEIKRLKPYFEFWTAISDGGPKLISPAPGFSKKLRFFENPSIKKSGRLHGLILVDELMDAELIG